MTKAVVPGWQEYMICTTKLMKIEELENEKDGKLISDNFLHSFTKYIHLELYSTIECNIVFERSIGIYAWQIYLPSIFLNFAALFSLFIPTTSDMRMTLCVTAFLTIVALFNGDAR